MTLSDSCVVADRDIKESVKCLEAQIYNNDTLLIRSVELVYLLEKYLFDINVDYKIVQSIIHLIEILRLVNHPSVISKIANVNLTTLIPSLSPVVRQQILEQAHSNKS